MRQLVLGILATLLPVAAMAEDAVIRIEAKRGTEAAQVAADGWVQKFDDVVTLPLDGGWVGIALGPLPREEADARLAELLKSGQIPADSFVSVPSSNIVLTPVAPDDPDAETEAGATSASDTGTAEMPQPDSETADNPEVLPVPATGPTTTAETLDVEPVPVVTGPDTFIRLQSVKTEAEADTALATWREDFPEAGVWHLPGGWFGVAFGPLEEETAQAWLGAFRQAGLLPNDAFTSHIDEMGVNVTPGEAPDLPAPEGTVKMPPIDEVQSALRWAGLYSGDIDGKAGPQTQAAIQAEILEERLSPDPGTAMRKLMERRDQWRDEMGLTLLEDEHTGLALMAPMEKLKFDRTERALSIYGPANGSGGALILFSQPGGQQELLDLTGLITALGWVPQPERQIKSGYALLKGKNSDHFGLAEGWVRDGRAEGFVLVWPTGDAKTHERLAAEMSDSITRLDPKEEIPGETDPVEGQSETPEPAHMPAEQ